MNLNLTPSDTIDIEATENSIALNIGTKILNLLGIAVTTWDSAGVYAVGDIVVDNLQLYENLTGDNINRPSEDTTNWKLTSILVDE